MVFSSLVFLCLFLPVTIILYRLIPTRMRNILLLAVSLIFYAWGEPKYILLMVASITLNYLSGILLSKYKERHATQKLILTLDIILNLGFLCFFKYTDFVIENINTMAGTSIGLLELVMPIGISFYTFQTMSYVIDVYRGNVNVQRSILDFGMYVTMFPQLIAGPIVRYCDIESQIKTRNESSERFFKGIFRFVIGLSKKVLLANTIGALWAEISAASNLSAATAWIGALAFSFQIYFDFSGYSDMAIGLGLMFGFDFPENFNYPYQATSITDFWRRWHITLGTWFREYLYIPLGGNRKGLLRLVLNLLIVWALTGLWHGAGWNFLIWGLYFFVILTVEKLFLGKLLVKLPRIIRHVYSLILIVLGWVIFACDDITMLPTYIASLFGANAVGVADMSLYYLSAYGVLFIIMALACTQLPAKLAGRLFKNEVLKFYASATVSVVLLALCIAFIVGGSYNPFLYFRF